MRTFDLYQAAGTPSQGFFEQPLSAGSMTNIFSAGLGNVSLADRQTHDLIEMVVLNGGLAAIPREAAAFERLPFIEAEVLEPRDDGAKIILRSVTTVGVWARAMYSLGKSSVSSIPEASRPSPEVLAALSAELRSKEGVVWVADAWPQDPAAPTAVSLFKCEFDKRCLVLTSSGANNYLVKL